ncbi:MAG: thiamine pyrophosphate-dependent enzyme [Thermoplasmata archaeon]|jgi:pyruvate dehydrogenase E1 component alpha subunit
MTEPVATVPLPYRRREAESLLGPGGLETLRTAFRWMLRARALDARMQALQRQGRIGFYGAATGQEAVNIAAGLVSQPGDWIASGLREQLVALVRGHDLTTYVHHLFADALDPALGRNMPCHPTAREVHYLAMSSVIGTQISHAVGLARAAQYRHDPSVTLAFFGDGATSSNDFHAGLNFAGVWKAPVVFCCTNNQWAISIPVDRQTAVPRLAMKASAYGLPGQQVDGTDFVAAYSELGRAIERARSGQGPTLLEFVLYRMTPHSTSDDPTRYQPADWATRARAHDPVDRLRSWLLAEGLTSLTEEAEWSQEADAQVRAAVERAEATPPPPPDSLFRDTVFRGGG